MSNIKELLNGVKVEWKSVLEIIEDKFWIMPATPKFDENEKIPYITSKNIKNGHINFEKVSYISYSDYLEISHNRPILAGDILISMIGTIGEVAKVKEQDLEFYGQNMYLLRLNNQLVNSDYFLHFFDSPKMKNHFSSVKNNSGQGYLKAKDIDNLLIPIPPLHVQSEIVRILDNFTELTAELTAELTGRKKQYGYYRDKLLILDDGECGFKLLGEIGEVRMCKRILKEQTLPEGEVPFYKIGTFGKEPDAYIPRKLFEEYKAKYNYPKIGEILISASGTIGRTVVFDGRDSYFQDSNIVWIENDEKVVLNKYLFYYYQIASWGISEGGTIQRLYNDNLRKLKIPIPYLNDPVKSLKEQEKIVSILDKFDALINSISEGLPKEIELRKKQYEYYRDLLLTFPKKEVEA